MPDTGFTKPTVATIISRVSTDLNTRFPTLDSLVRGSFLYKYARTLSGAVYGLYGYLDFIARQILVDTAEADSLDRHGAIWGITRTAAVQATGNVTFTGTPAATVTTGSEWQDAAGNVYTVDAPGGTIPGGGSVDLPVTAQTAGAAGNASAGVTLTAVSPLAGIDSTALVAAGGLTGGADIETDAAYRDRILARIRDAPQGGAEADYVAWAQSISTVDSVWVVANGLGAGTVVVYFSVTGGPIPGGAKVTEVQTYIDTVRPVTADVTVSAPTGIDVYFDLDIEPNTSDVQDAIEAELTALFAREGDALGGTIKNSLLREAVSTATGEEYHVVNDIVIDGVSSGATADITLAVGEIPVLDVASMVYS